ncbi:MAG: hypothetical protein EXS69_00810 [Candidatus Zambryskibacteria bacterium]|nr:hypothetical protein [Candidatus Zambryskibacteria bacterium]
MHEIIPAILPKDADDLREQLSTLPSEIIFFHMDVLEDDIWIKNNRDFEVHLMVEEPYKIMDRWIERGAKRLSVHTAGVSLAQYRDRAEIGLAIELDKSLDEVLPFLDFVDFVHVMSIDEIGEQGHKLDEKVFDRIRLLQEKYPDLPIAVDGGVTPSNYEKLLELGADRLIVGSHFKQLWTLLKTK